jgi:hypothetical protein
MNVVVSSVLPIRTVEFETKLAPFTVRVIPGVPAVTLTGVMLVMAGRGALMLKGCADDVPPFVPGVVTVILIVPEAAMRLAGIEALS